MKISVKNGSDLRPVHGDYSTTTMIELMPDHKALRVPSNVVILVDASSSMGGSKWAMVKQAVSELVDALKDDDRVALVLFDSNAKEVFPLASLSENRKTMLAAIEKLESPSGVTNLEAGLKAAYAAFEARSKSDQVKRVNHVILLTDGFPTDNQGYRVEKTFAYEEIVRRYEHITLTGIGIGSADDYDSTFISRLSELGRGSYYHANDMTKFKEGLQAEIQKLQGSVVGDLVLRFSKVHAKVMRIAKVAPEIMIYDAAGNSKGFEIKAGSMTKDLTAFVIQTNSQAEGAVGADVSLFTIEALYDGKSTEAVEVKIKTTDREADLTQVDPDVFRALQVLQVHLNGEQIQLSISSGDNQKATRIIENTARLANQLGQDKVTRALTRLASDLRQGKSVSDDLATIKDEAKKTKIVMS